MQRFLLTWFVKYMFRFEPLNSSRHRELKLKVNRNFQFAAWLDQIDLTHEEIWRAAASFPVVFVQLEGSESVPPRPVMVVSRSGQRNILVANDDNWCHPFMPMSVRLYPFSLGIERDVVRVSIDGSSSYLGTEFGSGEAISLFYLDGSPSKDLEKVLSLASVLSTSIRHSMEFCTTLQKLNLLVRVETEFFQGSQTRHRYYHVPKERLDNLPEESVVLLRRRRWLPLIYAHIQSLERDCYGRIPLFWARTRRIW